MRGAGIYGLVRCQLSRSFPSSSCQWDLPAGDPESSLRASFVNRLYWIAQVLRLLTLRQKGPIRPSFLPIYCSRVSIRLVCMRPHLWRKWRAGGGRKEGEASIRFIGKQRYFCSFAPRLFAPLTSRNPLFFVHSPCSLPFFPCVRRKPQRPSL